MMVSAAPHGHKDLRLEALRILLEADPGAKAAAALALPEPGAAYGELDTEAHITLTADQLARLPGRPLRTGRGIHRGRADQRRGRSGFCPDLPDARQG